MSKGEWKGMNEMLDERILAMTREQLVEEYCSIKLANIVNFVGTDWYRMPVDVPQDPAYWKKIDGDLHNMHYRIAELYHINRDECLWLENLIDSDNLYITDRHFKPLVRDAIKWLEEAEEKHQSQLPSN